MAEQIVNIEFSFKGTRPETLMLRDLFYIMAEEDIRYKDKDKTVGGINRRLHFTDNALLGELNKSGRPMILDFSLAPQLFAALFPSIDFSYHLSWADCGSSATLGIYVRKQRGKLYIIISDELDDVILYNEIVHGEFLSESEEELLKRRLPEEYALIEELRKEKQELIPPQMTPDQIEYYLAKLGVDDDVYKVNDVVAEIRGTTRFELHKQVLGEEEIGPCRNPRYEASFFQGGDLLLYLIRKRVEDNDETIGDYLRYLKAEHLSQWIRDAKQIKMPIELMALLLEELNQRSPEHGDSAVELK